MLGLIQSEIAGFWSRSSACFALFAMMVISTVGAAEPVVQTRQDKGVEKQSFLRLSRDVKKEPCSLDTAIVEYSLH